MTTMTPDLLRRILAYHHQKTATYIAGEPVRCPLCVAFKLNPPPAPVTKSDVPMRYHRCPMCGSNFKSIEKEQKPTAETSSAKRSDIIRPSKLPDSIAPKRKKRNIKDR